MSTVLASAVAALASSAVVASSVPVPKPQLLASIPMTHPSFVSLDSGPYPGGDVNQTLVVTSFSPFSGDAVYAVSNIKEVLKGAAPNIDTLNSTVQWPNQAKLIGEGTVPGIKAPAVLVAGGFLLYPKTTGKIMIYPIKSEDFAPFQISTDKKGYFYHNALWEDINGDGLLDILTARAHKPVFGAPDAELLWYEQPKDTAKALGGTWPEHVITSGPGVQFIMYDLGPSSRQGKESRAIIASEFFKNQRLAMYTCNAAKWSDCNEQSKNVHTSVIDSQEGPFFNVGLADINNDGQIDLFASTNSADGQGSVLAYEIPPTLPVDNWPQHRLATGFKPSSKGPGKGAPGTAVPMHFKTTDAGKPRIIVSGDDEGTVTILTPLSESPQDWSYQKDMVLQSSTKATIGDLAVGDMDGDGIVEVAVPYYANKKVEIYQFS